MSGFEWNAKLAYAIGLLTSDGCLSGDGRHLEFCSKDLELVELFCSSLKIKCKIGTKSRGTFPKKRYYRVQFGNVKLYGFLLSIGLMPRKSLTLKALEIPDDVFSDFLRGLLDGDGNINVFKHPESRHPQLKLRLYSGSSGFLSWLKETVNRLYGLERGSLFKLPQTYCLNYSKEDSIYLFNKIYYNSNIPYLNRKYLVAKPFLKAGVAELV